MIGSPEVTTAGNRSTTEAVADLCWVGATLDHERLRALPNRPRCSQMSACRGAGPFPADGDPGVQQQPVRLELPVHGQGEGRRNEQPFVQVQLGAQAIDGVCDDQRPLQTAGLLTACQK